MFVTLVIIISWYHWHAYGNINNFHSNYVRGAHVAVGDNLPVGLDLVSFHHDLILELRWTNLKAPVVELARVAEEVLAVLQQAVNPVVQMMVQL